MSLKSKPLDAQVVVINGASSGIRLVTARTAAARIAADLNAAGHDADFYVADVGDVDQVRAADAAVMRIDMWVNGAGMAIYTTLEATQVRLDRLPDGMRVGWQTVEHVFGTLKHVFGTLKDWMGRSRFRMRRLGNVTTGTSLHILAYNIKRAITPIGVPGLIAAM